VPGAYLHKTMQVAAIGAAGITVMISLMAAQWVQMGATGTRHTVTVTGERRVNPWFSKTDDFHYQLSVAGRSLPGELILNADDPESG
jgi:hypothetical protein